MTSGEEQLQKSNVIRKTKKKDKRPKIILISIICIFLLTLLTIAIYRNSESFRSFMGRHILGREVHENNLPEITINRNTNIYAHNGRIITLEQNTLRGYNRSGNEDFNLSVRIADPIFVSEGRFLIVAERGGNVIYLISGRNILWQKELEGDIDNITVNRNGYVAISMSDTTFNTVIETFNSERSKVI